MKEKDLIGKQFKDHGIVFEYDEKGVFVKDKYGVEKYINDDEIAGELSDELLKKWEDNYVPF